MPKKTKCIVRKDRLFCKNLRTGKYEEVKNTKNIIAKSSNRNLVKSVGSRAIKPITVC